MKTYYVKMLALGNGELRHVELEDHLTYTDDIQELLDDIYHYGQNDFQQQPFPSVSCGDVIIAETRFYLVQAIGFKELSEKELKEYEAEPRNVRWQLVPLYT